MEPKILPDPGPGATWREYQQKLGKELEQYNSFAIKQLNYMWLRDRLWFVKQLIADFGREQAKKKLEGLIDQKAEEIGTRYKRWAQEKGIRNPILAAMHGYSTDWPRIAPSWWLTYYPDKENPTRLIWRLDCRIGDFWREHAPEYQQFDLIFCEVDNKLVRQIDPGLTLERPMLAYSVPQEDVPYECIYNCENCEYCKFVLTWRE